jgi:tetratricopeptide (TPR) repeat protein
MVRGRWFERSELNALAQRPVPGYKRIMALEAEFESTLGKQGAQQAIRDFKTHSQTTEKLPESFVNALGYQTLEAKKLADAVALFTFNTELYPDSWNVYDSLGEAYADNANYDLAVLNYRHSLALNPKNTGAEKMLQKLASLHAK